MHYGGIDVHKKQSQICILDEQGAIHYEIRIPTDRPNFTDILRPYQGAQVLLESSTESEWVARHLESLGLVAIVADPNFAPMYATRSRKVKTDKRDARCLAQACKLGAYRPAHRLSDDRRKLRSRLEMREALVKTRTQFSAPPADAGLCALFTRQAECILFRGEHPLRQMIEAERSWARSWPSCSSVPR